MSETAGQIGDNTAGGGTPGSSTSSLGYGASAGGDPRADGLDVTSDDTGASEMAAGMSGDEGEGFGQYSAQEGAPTAAGGLGVDQQSGEIHLANSDAAKSGVDADQNTSTSDSLFEGNDSGVTPGYTSEGPAGG